MQWSCIYHLPMCNLLSSSLIQGTLVVEAAQRSGSLITARLAAELGREVFAIPGSIHSPLARGCHALIRQGAKLVESADDIHEELHQPTQGVLPSLRPVSQADAARHAPKARTDDADDDAASDPSNVTDDDNGRKILAALGYDPAHPDVLLQRTGLDAS